jgi:inorganic pyrophosphatase
MNVMTTTDLLRLPLRDESGAFHVVVEAPRGSLVKTKYEPRLGVFVVKRPLLLGTGYPYDWGFFPSTCADDGDPLDAMVLSEMPTWPGVVIPSTPIGVLRVTQRERKADKGGGGRSRKSKKRERNDRLLVVPTKDARFERVSDLPGRIVQELEAFFVLAGEMAEKEITLEGWEGPKAARRALLQAAARFGASASSE